MTLKKKLIICYLMMMMMIMMIQCHYSGTIAALSSLPAPVNPTVNSTNFHHVFTWDPGPGTPPGTKYIVYCRSTDSKKTNKFKPSYSTSRKMKLDLSKEYYLSVQASLNNSTSPNSTHYNFCPYRDTIIGPPMLSVRGCGTCIQLNISMPKSDNDTAIDGFQKLYSFKIYCRKDEQEKEKPTQQVTSDTSYRVEHLSEGVKYCIKVKPMITTNKNTLPSEWKCDYTSRLEPSRGPAVVSSLASILLVGGFVLVLLFSCLYYTGFVCRLQHLPALFLQIHPNTKDRYILTAERTVPDSVSIQSDPEKQMTANNRRPLRPNMDLEEENEEEDDECGALYIQCGGAAVSGGAAEFSSGASSVSDSASGPAMPTAAISGGCGSLRAVVELAAEGVEPGGHGQVTEGNGERAAASFSVPDLDQPGILGHVGKAIEEVDEMREEEEQKNSSGQVNLFAVTLGSQEEDDVNLFSVTLGSREEDEDEYDEEQSAKDFLGQCDERPLLPPDSPPRTSEDTGAQRVTLSGDGTLQAGLPETCPLNEYVDRHSGNTDTDSETEEEEEFSGYMGR